MLRNMEKEMQQSSNVIQFPGLPQQPAALAGLRGLVGMPQWRRGAHGGWWLTVLAAGICAHARVKPEASGRWSGFVSRSRRRGGWQYEGDIDNGTLVESMRAAEQAIARLAASAV
jgi:hypothetical protein